MIVQKNHFAGTGFIPKKWCFGFKNIMPASTKQKHATQTSAITNLKYLTLSTLLILLNQ